MAQLLNVGVSFVYEHADELGAIRLGSRPRARLRFRLEAVEEWLDSCAAARSPKRAESGTVRPLPQRCRGAGSGTNVELLPIRGREAA